MNSWKAILAALVIFGAGLVTGAVWTKVSGNTNPHPISAVPARPNGVRPALGMEHLRKVELMMRVQKDLNLTPEQRERIEKIIGDGQQRIRELWDQVAPDIKDELDDVKAKLCKELTPEQKATFDDLMKHPPKPAATSTNAPAPAVPK